VLAASNGYAQDGTAQIDTAIALYTSDRPDEAAQRLRRLLAAAEAGQLAPDLRARAFTYLAMSEGAMYRRPAAQAALESALRTDSKAFMDVGGAWARSQQSLVDSAAFRLFIEGVALFDEAEYAASVEQLARLQPVEPLLSPALAGEVHKYLAFNFVAQRKQELAQKEFRTALRFNPSLQLGEEAVIAPKLRRAFMAVRDNTLQKAYRSSRRHTLIRSLALPGWGQVYRGARVRGYAYMATQAGLLAGTLLSVRSFIQARNDYTGFDADEALAIYAQRNAMEDVKAELNDRYDRYRTKGQQANLMIGLFAGVWAVNMIDALILSRQRDRLAEEPILKDRPPTLTMGWDAAARQWRLAYGFTW
jgi:hypothetical protein